MLYLWRVLSWRSGRLKKSRVMCQLFRGVHREQRGQLRRRGGSSTPLVSKGRPPDRGGGRCTAPHSCSGGVACGTAENPSSSSGHLSRPVPPGSGKSLCDPLFIIIITFLSTRGTCISRFSETSQGTGSSRIMHLHPSSAS